MSGSYLCIPRNETVQPPYFQNRINNVLSPNSYTHISVRDLYISRIGLVCLWCFSQICGPILKIFKLGLRPRNSQEYINGIFVAVCMKPTYWFCASLYRAYSFYASVGMVGRVGLAHSTRLLGLYGTLGFMC
jgi:hypothetical protein